MLLLMLLLPKANIAKRILAAAIAKFNTIIAVQNSANQNASGDYAAAEI